MQGRQMLLTWRLMVGAFAVTAAAGTADGQTPSDYFALEAEYATHPSAAVAALAAWPRSAVNEAVAACLHTDPRLPRAATCTMRQQMRAAMMHTDVATVLFDARRGDASFHIRAASTLIDVLANESEFSERWWSLVAGLFASRGEIDDARAVLRDGLARHPRSAALLTMRGVVEERAALGEFANLRGQDLFDEAVPGRIPQALERAARDYLLALEIDPAFVEARLHLGWNRMLLRDARARDDLNGVVERATDTSVLYLARLFLGGLSMREGDVEEAAAQYSEAQRIGPHYQSACVARSHALAMLGRGAEPQTDGGRCTAVSSDESDPWAHWATRAPHPRHFAWLRNRVAR
jgi:tetratricopeptide (TPR) repeat protein